IAVGRGDRLEEAWIVAARFTADVDVLGDDVGRFTSTLSITASDAADVGSARTLPLKDLAKPAARLHLGQRQGSHHDRGDALFRRDTSVGGPAEDLRFPAFGSNGAHGQIRCRATVHVETHDRSAKVGWVQVTGAKQTALLAHGEKQRQRWMR